MRAVFGDSLLEGMVSVSTLLRLRAHFCPRVPRRIPRLELSEQCFFVGPRLDISGGRVFLQECLEAFSLCRFETMFDEPLLRKRQAVPASERSRKGNLLPLGMKRRVLQKLKFREEGIHEQSKPTTSFSIG